MPSRWAICSGRHDETVADGPVNGHSPFAQSIIDVLETTEREYISSDFLLMQVREQTRANYDQLPDGGPLQHVDHKRGQYVFRRIDSITADTEQWERIALMPEDTLSEVIEKLKEIREFCEKYPHSIHGEAVKNKGELLEGLRKYLRLPNAKAALREFLVDFPDSPYEHEIKTRLTEMENRENDQKKWKRRLFGAAVIAGLTALIVYGRLIDRRPDPKPETTFQDSLAGVFRLVQAGQFEMGCSNGQRGCQEDEYPVHQVTLDSYYIGEFEITQAQWKAVMHTNPSSFAGCDDCPVERVSWNEVQEFIVRLNKLTGKKYRLPTEAEWEFAARAGEADYRFLYSGGPDVNDFVWYMDNSSGKTRTVGLKRPNKLGLFDMNGNVWEWCQDKKATYFEEDQKNPDGPATGYRRVLRGGAWNSSPEYCRISVRGQAQPSYRYNFVGFRLAMSINY